MLLGTCSPVEGEILHHPGPLNYRDSDDVGRGS